MKKAKVTLILGAGASVDRGFPVGAGLRKAILDLPSSALEDVLPVTGRQKITQFQEQFMASQRYSIDAFLGRRTEFSEIGKAAIAAVILHCESASRAVLNDDQRLAPGWYQYLANQLFQDEWDEFDPGWLSVVTFNYDRSLEEFLVRACAAAYGKKRSEAEERIRLVRFVHVYGSLGAVWRSPDYLAYGAAERGSSDWGEHVALGAQRISVIPEGRDTDPSLVKARTLIASASSVCFLGFGFDADNVRRLGAPQIFCRHRGSVPCIGTALGLSDGERRQAHTRLFSGMKTADLENEVLSLPPLSSLMSMDCLTLLRETLVLG